MTEPEETVERTHGQIQLEKPTERVKRYERNLESLRENARMFLVEIARRTKISKHTIYDCFERIEDRFWFSALVVKTRSRTSHDGCGS